MTPPKRPEETGPGEAGDPLRPGHPSVQQPAPPLTHRETPDPYADAEREDPPMPAEIPEP